MTDKQQIEKMAHLVCGMAYKPNSCRECAGRKGGCFTIPKMERLYAVGYRKQSVGATDINVGNKSEWISVNERLPNEGEDVLALCYYHETYQPQVCYLSPVYKGRWITSVAGQWARVTHWMPLPEAPKGGE